MIILAFDYGTKKIGVAIGEFFTSIARPIKCISYKKNYLIHIEKIIYEWKPKKIIVGLPLNYKGKFQKTTVKAKNFALNIFKKFNIKVILHDERFSTIEAKSILFKKKGSKLLTLNKINSTSAYIILKSWLYEKKKQKNKRKLKFF
ncbi:MAG: Holliday junction resolvase RuvX [Buchnera aphidicola (Periphyllus lyropictus)]|uniref:Holliday junction resolvase RuvX n=1 Tax=Buchnera aphidicola TaxID=9 RepID=UPI001EB94F8C|nr:Holliday junction resolvase RuvX [Buchnera aphidicola]NIH16450.1 Holliday junction resolvase RuvX [Buchnera aphidicola (Periphyllus lyropictus)]USS94735.1 Holliday junction resolvase RuvX [Buchnera aphidicola (Periphyllus lyropictus)]